MAITVLIESNFIFEIALNQEQAYYCTQLISLCEKGLIQLVIPAYCLVEPYEKLNRQEKSRKQLVNQLSSEINQLKRNNAYQNQLLHVDNLTDLLIKSSLLEQTHFDNLSEHLLTISTIIPLSTSILKTASIYRQNPYELSYQDAIVYASILDFLQHTSLSTTLFLNKNSKDFATPDIIRDLNTHSCKLFSHFEHAYKYLQTLLSTA